MRQSQSTFPHITNEMIESGMRRARVERSKFALSLFDTLFGGRSNKKRPSVG
ncbi:MAG: hypothetical protein ABJH63_10910 [Rhizobiaceae bacterium]